MAETIQRATGTATGAVTATFSSAVGSGNSILAMFVTPPWTGAPSAVQTGGAANLTLIHTSGTLAPGESRIVRIYRIDNADGETSVTVTIAAGPSELSIVEVSGLSTGVTDSAEVSTAALETNAGFTMSLTTAAVGDFLFGLSWRTNTLSVAPTGTLQDFGTGRFVFDAIADAATSQDVVITATSAPVAYAGVVISVPASSSAATLSSPTSASVTQTGATIGATTDDATGTLYGVVTTSASAPSATQIKAGQDHTGSAAAGSGSNASLSVGANTIAITGLTAATSYYYYLVQDNGSDSNVVNGTFTTAVNYPVLTSPTAVSIGTTTVTPRVTTDTGNGTCYYVITPQAESEPSNTQVEAGTNAADGAPVASGSQVVSASGVITFSEVTGLTAGTAYRISYAHSGTPS